MDTYTVGRAELLAWINSTLDLNLTKIEQTSTGAVACQLLDVLHPGAVSLAKVDFNARDEYTAINNYKVLQAGFNKLRIDKPVEVNKLVKARPLDNMEFMQWFKAYWDAHAPAGTQYDPVQRRQSAKTGDLKAGAKKRAPGGLASGPSSTAGTPRSVAGGPRRGTALGGTPLARPAGIAQQQSMSESEASTYAQLQELTEQVTDLKLKVDDVERERDFYFDKLRDIEILCQTPEVASVPIVQFIEKILYAQDENEAKEAMLQAQETYNPAPDAPNGNGAAAPAAAEAAAAE